MSYENLHTYDFDSDAEYRAGLYSILEQVPPELSEPQKESIILEAKCFYISRKYNINPPLDPSQYQTWIQRNYPATSNTSTSNSTEPTATEIALSSSQSPNPQTSSEDHHTTSTQARDSAAPPQPTYPPSFAELVDLITQNKPIPGIEEIPDTVIPDVSLTMTEEPTISGPGCRGIKMGRKKPWEKQVATESSEPREGAEPEHATENVAISGSSTT